MGNHKLISHKASFILMVLIAGFFPGSCASGHASADQKEYLVQISTDMGDITVILYNETPQHRDNFLKLAQEGYYDGLLFHRVISGFMIQAGDPHSRDAEPGEPLGSGGPGYTVPAEIQPGLFHQKGALSAARQGDQINPERRSSGSQFYIVQGRRWAPQELEMMARDRGTPFSEAQMEKYTTVGGTPHLDDAYTVFGQVIDGMEVIDRIAAVETGPRDRPEEDVRIKGITVIE